MEKVGGRLWRVRLQAGCRRRWAAVSEEVSGRRRPVQEPWGGSDLRLGPFGPWPTQPHLPALGLFFVSWGEVPEPVPQGCAPRFPPCSGLKVEIPDS